MKHKGYLANSVAGFTLIELIVVAAIIGVLLAIAIPNLIKARISANEANARKSMQTLRDAEGEFLALDLDGDEKRDYANAIGDLSTPGTLRCPSSGCGIQDALVTEEFEKADSGGSGSANCQRPKAGYCVQFDSAVLPNGNGDYDDFGWQASPRRVNRTGRRDFSVYGDALIRCSVSTASTGSQGQFDATRSAKACD